MARAGGRQRAAAAGELHEESDLYVRALARGLSILALFDIEHPDWGLNEICAQTGISKTTAYRMLRTMEAKEVLAYDASSERYHLGKANIPLAYLALSYVGFVRSAHRFLDELAETTGETVELSVLSPAGAVIVDEVATKHPFRLNRPTGRISDNLANSSFRLHVAFQPPAEQQKYLSRPRQKLTPNTIIDREEIELRMVAEKEEGIAFDMEELDLGVCAASAPVYEPDGTVKAVVTVVAPAERFVRDQDRHVAALKSTAAKMTRYLSGQPATD
jgi:DNA-binding IclR family transcriptional regulator